MESLAHINLVHKTIKWAIEFDESSMNICNRKEIFCYCSVMELKVSEMSLLRSDFFYFFGLDLKKKTQQKWVLLSNEKNHSRFWRQTFGMFFFLLSFSIHKLFYSFFGVFVCVCVNLFNECPVLNSNREITTKTVNCLYLAIYVSKKKSYQQSILSLECELVKINFGRRTEVCSGVRQRSVAAWLPDKCIANVIYKKMKYSI